MSKDEEVDSVGQRGGDGDELRAAVEEARETTEAFKQTDEAFERIKEVRSSQKDLVTADVVKQMIDDARARLPRVYEFLQGAGLKGDKLDAQMIRLAAMPFDETMILHLLDDGSLVSQSTALATVEAQRSPVRRRLTIVKHNIIRWWDRKQLLERLFYLGGWLFALLGPSIQKGWTWAGGIGIAVVIGMRVRSQWKDLDREDLPVLESNQRRRQLQLERLIERTQRWCRRRPTPEEKLDFRRDVLELITSYVRDHRSDTKGRQIYANLLIRRGSAVVVIARSDLLRKVPAVYTAEECSLAWKTLETGAPQCTGDVYLTAPATRKGKSYNSILVLPIKDGTRVVGAVSIDSESKYHFDSCYAELHGDLAPYVQLLAITLTEDHDTSGTRELTDGEHGSSAGDPRHGS